VQKLAAFAPPMQQSWPTPPQALLPPAAPSEQLDVAPPVLQVPSVPWQLVPLATQVLPLQQPFAAQVLLWQQG
jgi:hypothetical protein